MSCHRFNILADIIKGDLASKIGIGILFLDQMDLNVTAISHPRLTVNASMKIITG